MPFFAQTAYQKGCKISLLKGKQSKFHDEFHVPKHCNNVFRYLTTVNQLNLTAVKISFLKTWTYLAQENLAF